MILKIECMKSGEFKMKVGKALSNLERVNKAEVNLHGGIADIEVAKEIPENKIKKAIYEAGYNLVKIEKH
ncbi:MAG: heavy-metal-associated domain-containing protein [Kosmotogaceae bacterium]